MSDPRKSFQRKMRIQLEAWNARIEELKKRISNEEHSNRQKLEKQVQTLDEKKEAAQQQLRKMEQADEDSWQNFKISIESAMEDLRKNVQGFFNKIRK